MIYNPAARLYQLLLDAGLPVSYCRMEEQDKATIRLEWSSGPTAGQQTSANTIIAGFDPSDAAHQTWLVTRVRSLGQDRFSFNSEYIIERAIALILLREINNLRTWIRDFKSAVAASTNLANLQSRVAALSNTPDYTQQQLMDAIKAKLADGSVDGT